MTGIFEPESTPGWRVDSKSWWWQARHEGPSTVLNRPCQVLAQHTLSGMTFGGGKAAGAGSLAALTVIPAWLLTCKGSRQRQAVELRQISDQSVFLNIAVKLLLYVAYFVHQSRHILRWCYLV